MIANKIYMIYFEDLLKELMIVLNIETDILLKMLIKHMRILSFLSLSFPFKPYLPSEKHPGNDLFPFKSGSTSSWG